MQVGLSGGGQRVSSLTVLKAFRRGGKGGIRDRGGEVACVGRGGGVLRSLGLEREGAL